MAIDTHMHINSKVLDNPFTYVDKINKNNSIDSVINVGLNIETSKESTLLTIHNQKFYSAVGIHPLYIENESIDALYSLLNDKVIAIGEIGLDNTKNNFI